MEKQFNQVAEFHRKIGETVAESATLLQHDAELDAELARSLRQIVDSFNRVDSPTTQLSRRALMAVEELAEWIEAHVAGDIVEAADAIGDRLYVLLGDAVATGLPLERVFDEVHRSNLTKHGSSSETGKGTKTETFAKPELGKLLESSLVDSRKTCLSCRFKMWMVGIGQGVQCKHPENRTAEGEYLQIPNRTFSCDHHKLDHESIIDE
ncbi:nucleoside triphosphate pyrophosphohydrolase family protein [Stieleria sp. TO1_6]|uniref:nucleoside triphosphate pyrophosphohydrolase family protein n=1 Tax=Stieleria tagensis TaxID=2956795 RepID=UPI00209AD66C|nr:nucleoside triphosphate pyrophosphohydrolase family protein [Stieleria tagensis]MCO8122621.1 nucleoside triphosphate pyrophosphohydrolase family protein [Stieleria tagensis]